MAGVRGRAPTETRDAVLRAARAVLSDPDPGAWSMEAVAARAGVTRMTVYNQFGSRTGLVEAVLDEVVARDRMDRLVAGTGSMDPTAAVHAAVVRTCRFWHAERSMLRRLFATAYEEAAVAELLQRREGWRREQFLALLARLDLGADPGSTADLLVALTGFPTYDRLGEVAEDPDAAAELLGRLLPALLCPQPARPGAPGDA